ETEVAWLAAASAKVDGEDLLALTGRGQVHEEQLVEAAFAQQLRRQVADLVRGGDNEHRLLLLLEPGEERAEDAGADPRVVRLDGRPGEPLLDLVDPEDGRGNRF